MRTGLLELLGSLRLFRGATHIQIQTPASVPSTYTLTLPAALPGSTQALTFTSTGVGGFAPITSDPTGTSSSTFQLDNDASGVIIKNVSGALHVRNAADNAFANLQVQNLTVWGTTTTVESETVAIADNILLLNSNATTAQNGGLEVLRPSSSNASLIWDEAAQRWEGGLAGAEITFARYVRIAFTSANVVAGLVTLTHNLNQAFPIVTVWDSGGKIIIPDDVTSTSVNSSTIDLTNFASITGTWYASFTG